MCLRVPVLPPEQVHPARACRFASVDQRSRAAVLPNTEQLSPSSTGPGNFPLNLRVPCPPPPTVFLVGSDRDLPLLICTVCNY